MEILSILILMISSNFCKNFAYTVNSNAQYLPASILLFDISTFAFFFSCRFDADLSYQFIEDDISIFLLVSSVVFLLLSSIHSVFKTSWYGPRFAYPSLAWISLGICTLTPIFGFMFSYFIGEADFSKFLSSRGAAMILSFLGCSVFSFATKFAYIKYSNWINNRSRSSLFAFWSFLVSNGLNLGFGVYCFLVF